MAGTGLGSRGGTGMLTYSFLLTLLLAWGTGICAVATEEQLSLSDTKSSGGVGEEESGGGGGGRSSKLEFICCS